jgi:hypothetical protein
MSFFFSCLVLSCLVLSCLVLSFDCLSFCCCLCIVRILSITPTCSLVGFAIAAAFLGFLCVLFIVSLLYQVHTRETLETHAHHTLSEGLLYTPVNRDDKDDMVRSFFHVKTWQVTRQGSLRDETRDTGQNTLSEKIRQVTRQRRRQRQRTKGKGQRAKDKGQRTKGKGQRTKDKVKDKGKTKAPPPSL